MDRIKISHLSTLVGRFMVRSRSKIDIKLLNSISHQNIITPEDQNERQGCSSVTNILVEGLYLNSASSLSYGSGVQDVLDHLTQAGWIGRFRNSGIFIVRHSIFSIPPLAKAFIGSGP
ncbi:hypothetical protein NPIL_700101 [Nephila pilipes]|uniref:Uncharacterized protein n=1 Tax=Nephila pilipes TaxID=299642 RepID=A0A8X6NDS2_NEPPI|nr:hypothetical protein NPIL_700101 [Nephila pilipes]